MLNEATFREILARWWENISRNVASFTILVQDVIDVLYHKHWRDKRKWLHKEDEEYFTDQIFSWHFFKNLFFKDYIRIAAYIPFITSVLLIVLWRSLEVFNKSNRKCSTYEALTVNVNKLSVTFSMRQQLSHQALVKHMSNRNFHIW